MKKDLRGKVGAENLTKAHKKKVLENKKKLKKTLDDFRSSNIPIIITEISERSGISVATLYRSPYKEIISEYREEEKVLFSPRGKQEVAALIKEIDKLNEELKIWKEKYFRLKKEITYSRELFE